MNADHRREADVNQGRAADPAHSVFVIANAGSGKTKVLVDRIARLLLQGSRPSAFLCITYTKAAAAEMQRRLFERLGGWCVADDARLREDLDRLGAQGVNLARARALFAQALETPGGLKIQTIHAFCERLLARFPLEAGVPPGFQIADEARAGALLAEARAAAALGLGSPQEAFKRFARRLSGDALEELLDRLASRRADFRHFAERRQGELFAAQALRDRHGVVVGSETLVSAFVDALDRPAIWETVETLEASSTNDRRLGGRVRRALDQIDSGGAPDVIAQAFFAIAFNDNGERYKTAATATLTKQHPWLAHRLENVTDAIVALRDRFNASERAEDAAAALALGLNLDENYSRAKDRAGALDFDDLIERALDLLCKSDAAPWVLYKLDGGVDHILIDEGQDTSPGQWDLITPLQEEFFAGLGARERVRTVFAVGDPKQSIYAFQGADPARFLDEAQRLSNRAANAGSSFIGPELRTSFRSVPQVLDAVDKTFARKPLVAAEPARSDVVRHFASRADEDGVVEVWPLCRRPLAKAAKPWDAPIDVELGSSVHAVLASTLAERVKAMIAAREAVWEKGARRAVRAGDVLALVRKRGPLFRELIRAFKRAGLPVAGADRMTLCDELAVEDCLALMRVALDPADDLALACVLKGPWLGLTDDDADLFPLAYGRRVGETLLQRLQAETSDRYASARAFAAALIERADWEPFRFLSWALETAHDGARTGWECVFARLGPESRDPLEELLQRALKPAGHAAATLQRFVHDVEFDAGQIKRELEAETGAIRVMTVHGAKGLEAPVVILADTTAGVDDKPDNGLIFDDDDGPFVSFRSRDDDAKVSQARLGHAQRMQSEHWRLLYVAMTRARDRLIVCGGQHGNAVAGEAPESWRLAVEQALQELGAAPMETPFGEGLRWGRPATAPESPEAETSKPLTPPLWAKRSFGSVTSTVAAAPSRLKQIDPLLFSPRGEGRSRFRRGVLIHGLLQRLPELPRDGRFDAALAWLARQGVQENAREALAKEALSVTESSAFAAAFGVNSRAEAPVVGEVLGMQVRGVVDRLVVEQSRVLVLDFKTDRPAPMDPNLTPQEYVLQLALYAEVLKQIFPKKALNCALLWTEAPRLMELSAAQLAGALADLRES